jgi:hypothetical protein
MCPGLRYDRIWQVTCFYSIPSGFQLKVLRHRERILGSFHFRTHCLRFCIPPSFKYLFTGETNLVLLDLSSIHFIVINWTYIADKTNQKMVILNIILWFIQPCCHVVNYLGSKGRMIEVCWIRKDGNGSGHGLIMKLSQSICLEGPRKVMTTSVRIADIPADIRNAHLLNTIVKCYRYIGKLDRIIFY